MLLLTCMHAHELHVTQTRSVSRCRSAWLCVHSVCVFLGGQDNEVEKNNRLYCAARGAHDAPRQSLTHCQPPLGKFVRELFAFSPPRLATCLFNSWIPSATSFLPPPPAPIPTFVTSKTATQTYKPEAQPSSRIMQCGLCLRANSLPRKTHTVHIFWLMKREGIGPFPAYKIICHGHLHRKRSVPPA
jgi:hypothetical protein